MKIRCFLPALLLLLSPALVQASDYVENGSSAIWSLRQLSDLSGDRLPQDLLNVLGKNLIALEHHGVWLPAGAGKKWVPVEKIVSDLTAFRDSESSEAEITAVLEIKEQIKEGLLKKLSIQWAEGLEDLVGKKQRQENGSWHAGKAYGAAFLAYSTIEISAAWVAARDDAANAAREAATNAAREAATNAATNAAWYAATNAATNAARYAARYAAMNAWNAARYAARYAAMNAWNAALRSAWIAAMNAASNVIGPSIGQKLKVLTSKNADEIGPISYDLAELFTLLWLTEITHEYMKMAFDAAYENFPEMELAEVKAVIGAEVNKTELKDNMFIKALKRTLDALEKFILAKYKGQLSA